MNTAPARRKRLLCVVTSAGSMPRTVVVSVQRFPWNEKLRKQVRRTTTLLVHDPAGSAQVGDTVEIEETRPLSKRKHFRLLHVVRRRTKLVAETVEGSPAEEGTTLDASVDVTHSPP